MINRTNNFYLLKGKLWGVDYRRCNFQQWRYITEGFVKYLLVEICSDSKTGCLDFNDVIFGLRKKERIPLRSSKVATNYFGAGSKLTFHPTHWFLLVQLLWFWNHFKASILHWEEWYCAQLQNNFIKTK